MVRSAMTWLPQAARTDSTFSDTGFISFGNKMVPMPPLIAQPPPPTPFLFQHANPWLGDIPLKRTPDAVQRMLSSGPESRMRGKLPERARMSGIVRTLIEMGMEEPPKPKEPTWFGELTENFSAEVSSRLNSRSNSRRGSLDGESLLLRSFVQLAHPLQLHA
jgi:hypothetical protein